VGNRSSGTWTSKEVHLNGHDLGVCFPQRLNGLDTDRVLLTVKVHESERERNKII
jgi:hypothetical protein